MSLSNRKKLGHFVFAVLGIVFHLNRAAAAISCDTRPDPNLRKQPLDEGSSCQLFTSRVEGITFPLFRSLAYTMPAKILDCMVALCLEPSAPGRTSQEIVQVACRSVFLDENGKPILSPGAGFFAPSYQVLSINRSAAETQGSMHFFRLKASQKLSDQACLQTEGNLQVLIRQEESSPLASGVSNRELLLSPSSAHIDGLAIRIEQKVDFEEFNDPQGRKELEEMTNPKNYIHNFPKIAEYLNLSENRLLMVTEAMSWKFEPEGTMTWGGVQKFMRNNLYRSVTKL